LLYNYSVKKVMFYYDAGIKNELDNIRRHSGAVRMAFHADKDEWRQYISDESETEKFTKPNDIRKRLGLPEVEKHGKRT
jgi:hypothetical protein